MREVCIFILLMIVCQAKMTGQDLGYDGFSEGNDNVFSNQLFVHWENDMYLQTDYYFTNGSEIEYISEQLGFPQLERFLITPFTLKERTYSLSFRQDMYTPINMYEPEIQFGDRPYAGYFIGEYKVISETNGKRFISSISVGVLGEYSFADYTQNLVHSMEHLKQAAGWQYQVRNSLVLNVNYIHEQIIYNNGYIDLKYSLNGRLGSLFTDASVGSTVRIGIINSSFDHMSAFKKNRLECYLFASASGMVSYHNATLQGGIFNANPSEYYLTNAERQLFIAKGTVGLVASYKNFRIKGGVSRISPEIKGGMPHGWGEVILGIAF